LKHRGKIVGKNLGTNQGGSHLNREENIHKHFVNGERTAFQEKHRGWKGFDEVKKGKKAGKKLGTLKTLQEQKMKTQCGSACPVRKEKNFLRREERMNGAVKGYRVRT